MNTFVGRTTGLLWERS